MSFPRTYYPAPQNDDHSRVRVFDPALKHYARAFRPGDPSFADQDDGRRWTSSRRLATDHVLRAIAESPLRERLILRGSRLLRAWVGDAAREPGDLDWIFDPSRVEPSVPDGALLLRQVVDIVFARPAPAAVELLRREVAADEIWTYDRVPGHRLVFPWRAEGLPGAAVQVDVVLGEPLADPDRRVSIALADGGATSVRAATPAQSLAWKLAWLTTDIWPQGKDLYDAVLLAERVALPREVLVETFRLAEAGPLPATAAALAAGWRTDWSNFRAEYPWIDGSEAEWLARLTKALEPTFLGGRP
jgi:Nucleotidyl transferase AbiEii toxin, Type IV TA system